MSGSTRSHNIASKLVLHGFEVNIITSFRDENPSWKGWKVTKEDGITVHWYAVKYSNKMSHLRRILAFLVFAVVSSMRACKLKCDIIFATSTPLTICIPGIIASKFWAAPMVFEVRDLWPEIPITIGALKNSVSIFLSKSLERIAYKNSGAIIALSPKMKAGVTATGYPTSRVVVIPNFSDINKLERVTPSFRSLNLNVDFESSPTLLYSGTLGKVNGVGYLVDLASELGKLKSNIKIIIVGSGAEEDQIKYLAKRMGVLNKNLFVCAPVTKIESFELLKKSTIASNLVIDLPVLAGNSSNKFFDTLAAKKPIFLNHSGWLEDIVISKRCGISASGLQLKQVALLLSEKLNDPDWLSEASMNSADVAKEHFNIDDLTHSLIKVILDVLDGRNDQVYRYSINLEAHENKKPKTQLF
ncbi:glycosyltransferase family 4 protein [Amylibacter sp.]|nr:glycosyltransferase family 4 protein [Amylibacter sp.]